MAQAPITREGQRAEAAPPGRLPYGAVMATAGASTLAGLCGLPVLVVPLLALAAIQALWVAAAGASGYRAALRAGRPWRWALDPPHAHTGIHTVPLGLAVIAGGFDGLDGAALPRLAWALFAVTWLATVICSVRFLGSLARHGADLERVDGAWFLVPAALLGAALASRDVAVLAIGRGVDALDLLALAAAITGWVGYWAVAVLAAKRGARFGLAGVPQAPWWIAMGCAGLAAAATGAMLDSAAWPPWLAIALAWATGAAIACAIVLCVPVLIASAAFLLRRCRFRGGAAWPPTFSTAVFALGCLESGAVLHVLALRTLGLGAGLATLALWAATAGWNTLRWMLFQITRRDGRDVR